ncbi:hypothetical protein ACWDCL_12055 [Streptomyces sp. NPDC001009]
MTTGTATTTTTTPAMPKTRAPHPLRAEAVRGFAPLAGAAVLSVLGVLLTASTKNWQGGWAETAALTHDALLITLPLSAAAGCWQGGRERRRRTEELWGTAVRAPLQRLLASALPVALWVAVGYLLAVALAALATWPYSVGDHPHLTRVPADTAALMAAALLGHLAGRTVPTLLAAPLLGVAGYVGLGIAARHGALDAINPAAFAEAGMRPVWWQPLAMATWTLGLALALTLAYVARRRATALLPLAAALTAGALLVQGGSDMWRSDPLADRQVCDTSITPAICVNARYAGLLPQVTTTLSGVTRRLQGVRNLPTRWVSREKGARAGEADLPMLTPLGWSVVRGQLTSPDQYAWEAVAALSHRGECEKEPERVLLADDAVQAYLAPSRIQSRIDANEAEGDAAARTHLRRSRAARSALAGMDEQRRRAWLSAYFAARATCEHAGVPSL